MGAPPQHQAPLTTATSRPTGVVGPTQGASPQTRPMPVGWLRPPEAERHCQASRSLGPRRRPVGPGHATSSGPRYLLTCEPAAPARRRRLSAALWFHVESDVCSRVWITALRSSGPARRPRQVPAGHREPAPAHQPLLSRTSRRGTCPAGAPGCRRRRGRPRFGYAARGDRVPSARQLPSQPCGCSSRVGPASSAVP